MTGGPSLGSTVITSHVVVDICGSVVCATVDVEGSEVAGVVVVGVASGAGRVVVEAGTAVVLGTAVVVDTS